MPKVNEMVAAQSLALIGVCVLITYRRSGQRGCLCREYGRRKTHRVLVRPRCCERKAVHNPDCDFLRNYVPFRMGSSLALADSLRKRFISLSKEWAFFKKKKKQPPIAVSKTKNPSRGLCPNLD